jgi:hypothetical protein
LTCKRGIIVDVEATSANQSQEVESTKTMIDRVERRHDLKPHRLVGDTAYGTAAMLGWMVEQKDIAPDVPASAKTEHKDNTFSSSNFQWDEEANEYRCPAGHALRSDRREFRNPRTHITKADTIVYRASQSDCKDCSMKKRCCPNTPMRGARQLQWPVWWMSAVGLGPDLSGWHWPGCLSIVG